MSDLCPPLIPPGIERESDGAAAGGGGGIAHHIGLYRANVMEKNSLRLFLCIFPLLPHLPFPSLLAPLLPPAKSIFADSDDRLSITDGSTALKRIGRGFSQYVFTFSRLCISIVYFSRPRSSFARSSLTYATARDAFVPSYLPLRRSSERHE